MPVSAQDTVFHHIANGVTVTFAFGCQVLQAADLKVYVNDELVTSGFAINGIGVPTGGAVTFNAAPPALNRVRIEREIVLERQNDYQQNGDFHARAVNPDFNRLWMALQQHSTLFNRSLLVPKSESTPLSSLPPIASRAGKFLSFDQNGAPLAILPVDSGASLAGWIQSGVGAIRRTVQEKLCDQVSAKDFGAKWDGASDDTTATSRGLAASTSIRLDGKTVVRGLQIPANRTVEGGATLIQDTKNQHTVEATAGAETNPALFPQGPKIIGLNFGAQPVADSDDFAAVTFSGARRSVVAFANFSDTESGVRDSCNAAVFGTSKGSTDTLNIGNTFHKVRRFVIQILQASYGRHIAIAADNSGDNTINNSGVNTGSNNQGNNGGIRLAGNGIGNLVALVTIRDRAEGVSYQLGQKLSRLVGSFFQNTLLDTLVATTGSSASRHSHLMGDIIIKDAGGIGANLRHMNHCRIDGIIDGTGKNAAASKFGVDLYGEISPTDETWFIPFNAGAGVVPAAGAVITQGGVSAVLTAVYATDAYAATAAGAAMPESGFVKVHLLGGGRFIAGALAGITATATAQATCGDGRHCVNVTIREAGSTAVRVGSGKNLVTAIVTNLKAGSAVEVSGSNNLVILQAADGYGGAATVLVTGSNNTFFVNESCAAGSLALRIDGSNNTFYGNISGTTVINGDSNSLNGHFAGAIQLNAGADGNKLAGIPMSSVTDNGASNDLSGLARGVMRGSHSGVTSATGLVTITHACFRTPARVGAVPRMDAPYFCTPTTVTSTQMVVKVWDAAGLPVANTAVVVDWEASV